MKVKEFIEMLQEQPQDLEVAIMGYETPMQCACKITSCKKVEFANVDFPFTGRKGWGIVENMEDYHVKDFLILNLGNPDTISFQGVYDPE